MAQEMDRCLYSPKNVDKIHNINRGDRGAKGPRGGKSGTGSGRIGTGADTTGTGAGTAIIEPGSAWSATSKRPTLGCLALKTSLEDPRTGQDMLGGVPRTGTGT